MIVAGVIVAAGRGERFGAGGKILAVVGGRPMLAWSLDAFEQCDVVRDVVIVAGDHTMREIEALIGAGSWPKVRQIVPGGAERSASVRCGIEVLAGDVDIVVIHDAARPMVTPVLIARSAEAAGKAGAAIVATPVTDTLKRSADGALIESTVDRSTLWAAQTPQAFRCDDLRHVFEAASADGATDEAMLFERAGRPVRIVPGSRDNMKVTVPEDLAVVDFLLRKQHEMDMV
jgi:2-C-methyl-D-erythritol 4-phosphate cytidylyltransferase